MNFKFWQRAAPAPAPEVKILDATGPLGNFLTFGSKGAETPSNALNLYNDSSAVSIPINKIAESFAGIEPVLEIGDKLIDSHPVLELLQNPGPFFDAILFRETIAKDYLITNESHIIALGNQNRPPLEIQPISPKNISVTEGDGGLAHTFAVSGNTLGGSYVLENKAGRARYFDGNLRELKQIRGYSTKNNSLLRGQSLLVSAAAEARQHILGNKHNISILEKGGRISLVFHYEEDVEGDDFEELKQRVRGQFGGADNAGQISVSSGGKMKVQELSKNNKDMDFAILQRMAMDSVALQYKCPLPLISNDASTFNNYAEAKVALYMDATLPLADRIYSALSQFLLPRYGIDPRTARLTYNPLSIPAILSRVLDELKTRKDINIESDNELRELIAREPYDGGGSVLKPANLLPVAMIGEPIEPDEPVVIRDNPNEPTT